ncbi:flavodoxin family protein [Burkholderia multivorans]|uniref:flavodoxin family protein n=1 Tax=Burkholderia multivorans TaxID=87883 RepID=UPI0006C82261|nr:flavodoxin family protein [Burkholderia multivorans]MCO8628298.1 flavodoxin family protein [Burkholderia multivorans]PRF39635.1 flavodoxin family protein [Burkholderia multivorans]PRG79270.1 flavodoxin family protein [Burkholderia multivorans]
MVNVLESTPLHFVVVTGSERASGNTEQVAEYVRSILADRGCTIDVLHLRDYRILPCGGCGECNMRRTVCQLNDDMPEIIARLCKADGVVYAAPVHGYGMAHLMQNFIERAGVGYLRFERPLANKIAGAVVTGRRYAHETVFHQLVSNFLLNRMILVGSGYPVVIHGGSPGAGMKDREGLESLRAMLARMVGMACLLRSVPTSLREQFLTPHTINERAA